MAGFEFDTSELRRFAVDVSTAGRRAVRPVMAALERGAVQIKEQLREEMAASTHFSPVARAISYDVVARRGAVTAEIGPTTGSPGSLANIAYFGTSRGGGTVPDPRGALGKEAPRFERAVGDILEGLL